MDTKEVFPIVVDYSKLLTEMIEVGRYDSVNSYITPNNFPVKGSNQVKLNIELMDYSIPMRSDADMVRNMEGRGLRPATLPELLAFGAAYPEKQREFTIVALGSVWRTTHKARYVVCLARSGLRREVHINAWDYGWDANCRFAAVRK